ncbi:MULTISPECIES: DUF1499 domain-containing protein [Bacillaceae]|uniref:DUF1499 domain-containing protein n=1 Tax=Evansella alkalicola TaxID=745819 RepID=A0ABS6JRI9_9BACI|nr:MULTISPECIES: DUF1499 domain-containing protein [Bacillaceae]MBU9721160.1 DUF1499 domain-containing protein [Bacillus alkalicola]
MSIKHTLQKYFSKQTETKEDHFDEKLRTHYYKSTKDKVMKEIESMLSQMQGFKIASISEEHGEIIVHITKGKKAFMVITVIMVKPFRTAVDLSISTDSFLFTDLGYSRKLVYELYSEMNKRMSFVGTSLGDRLIQS